MKRYYVRSIFALLLSLAVSTVFADGAVFPVATNKTGSASCAASVLHSASKATFCAPAGTPPVGNSFASVVDCNCIPQAPSPAICKFPSVVYVSMMARYGSLQEACIRNANGVNVQECEDQWNCYMYGTKGATPTEKISDGECFGLTDTTGC